MTSYETILQLHKAGIKISQRPDFYTQPDTTKLLYIPTLSELIEACGDNFLSLHRDIGDGGNYGDWTCHGEIEGKVWVTPYFSSPEDAVAELYLALHKK